MSSTLIHAENIDRYYADTHAVQDVSFDLHQGDILGLLGPNGAGKSTTMQIISGVLAPTSGSIQINGHDLLDSPRQAKRHIGYLPETPPLYPELSVDDYLSYAARLRRLPSGEIQAAVQQAKHRCGLENSGRRLISNLSKGYQQRVGIAQAIIHNPAVVILDEPTVGLDPIQIREIRELIAELGQQHGVILSTHILPEVQAICNQVKIIHRGQLVYSESVDSLNQQLSCNQLMVAFDRPPAEKELLAIAGVEKLDRLGGGRFLLYLQDAQPMGELIASAAVANDWGIEELIPQRQTLEQIFVQLTSGEEVKPA